jgi:hypothetical protein
VLADVSGKRRKSEFMSSHPDPGNRADVIKQEIAKRYPNGVPAELTIGAKIDLGTSETASEETPRRVRRP